MLPRAARPARSRRAAAASVPARRSTSSASCEGAEHEPALVVVKLIDVPTIGAREAGGVGDDRREHRIEIERRGDRLADLAKASKLVDRLRELAVRCRSSSNSRAFSMAMTAWSANVSSSAICRRPKRLG